MYKGNISIVVTNLNHPGIDYPTLTKFVEIQPYSYYEFYPYKNITEKKDFYVWNFETTSDYKLEICSSNYETNFIKFYSPSGYYYHGNCFRYYFSAMPQWQYSLFKEQSNQIKGSATMLGSIESSTRKMSISSNIMLWVAILTLIVSLLNLISIIPEKESKKERLVLAASIILIIVLVTFVLFSLSGNLLK